MSTDEKQETWKPIKDAAARGCVSQSSIRRMIKRGQVRAKRLAGGEKHRVVLVCIESLIAFQSAIPADSATCTKPQQ